jgi:hypothetical protein
MIYQVTLHNGAEYNLVASSLTELDADLERLGVKSTEIATIQIELN